MFKSVKKLGLGISTLFAAGSASAAVPAAVTTAMGDGATDAAAVAVLGLLIVIGIVVVRYMKSGTK